MTRKEVKSEQQYKCCSTLQWGSTALGQELIDCIYTEKAGAIFLLPFSHSKINSISFTLSTDSTGKPGTQGRGTSQGTNTYSWTCWSLQLLLPPIILALCEQECSIFWLLQDPFRSVCVCTLTCMFLLYLRLSVFKDSTLLFVNIIP